ncbi:hypothetical protein CAPTEDRAFT_206598 [Capitella teleta]|uniref:L-Fucosyltransferase n=1 Tax=Capitella teleta TaxID=283909 RepID=R7UBI7_CAPTE|nr:hypothetical protein CAPTEDRAFT_206598 [Capitella teleta]|eukprot:ELU00632.1 hypothetical protein CAPTEDRAFT_206598 [Capitella teleta]
MKAVVVLLGLALFLIFALFIQSEFIKDIISFLPVTSTSDPSVRLSKVRGTTRNAGTNAHADPISHSNTASGLNFDSSNKDPNQTGRGRHGTISPSSSTKTFGQFSATESTTMTSEAVKEKDGRMVEVNETLVAILEKELDFDSSRGNLIIGLRMRLGNLLFQFAALIGLALRHHMNPVYTKSLHKLALYFRIKERPLDNNITISMQLNEGVKMGGSDAKIINLKQTKENVELKGYFQCTDYFSGAEAILRSELMFRPDVIKAAQAKMDHLHPGLWKSNVTKIGIHIRRGDFLNLAYQGRTVAPTEYYKKAMQLMLSRHDDCVFIVTGNAKTWATEELSTFGSLFFVDNGLPHEDMYLLSACDHVIVSTGTFSWWVGWLNRGSVVYYDLYPKIGYPLAADFDAKKYYPPHWTPLH